MQQTQRRIAKSLERLSIGQRVNSPADDSAAYSSSVRLQSQIRGLAQASLNINRSRGLLSTVDAALEGQRSIVQEMRDLALQAANTTLSSAERSQINEALANLVADFQKITNTAEFNGIKLLDGSLQNLGLQIGANSGDQVGLSVSDMSASTSFRSSAPKGEFDYLNSDDEGGFFGNVELVDVDNDGNLDQVYSVEAGNLIGVRLGNGDGSFDDVITSSATDVEDFELADFDGDGNIDVLAASATGIELLLGDGEGNFTLESTYSGVTTTIRELEVGDFDNDGDLDIIRFGNSGKGYIYDILENDGNNNFSNVGATVVGAVFNDAELGDFDDDGILDIAYVLQPSGKGTSGTIEYRYGAGNLTFGGGASISVKSGLDFQERTPNSLAVGDVDGDGDDDIIVSNSGDQLVRFTNSGGVLGGLTILSWNHFTSTDIELVDIDNDGILDLLGTASGASTLNVVLGNGTGSFGTLTTYAGGSTGVGGFLAYGDIDNDGAIDVTIAGKNSTGRLHTFLGRTKSVSGLSEINVDTEEDAENLLEILDETTDRILAEQSKVGALLSRLDLTEAYNSLMSANYQEALDSSVSADFALEVAELLSAQIQQQAQVAVLAQANLQRQLVLELLPR